MKNIFLEQGFVNGLNAVAYRVKFANKVKFDIKIGEKYSYTDLETQQIIDLKLNIGYLMVIDSNMLQIININKSSYYGDISEYTPEEQLLFETFKKMDITLSSNELIFIYVHNCVTSFAQNPNPYFARIDNPITSVHLNLFGESKIKFLFKIANNKTLKRNISYLKKKLFTIDFNFNIAQFAEDQGPGPGSDAPVQILQLNSILYLMTLLNKLHIDLPPKISIDLHLNFPSNTINIFN